MRRRSIKVLDVILRKIPGVWIVEVPWLWVIPVDYDLAAATQTTGNSNWKSRERIAADSQFLCGVVLADFCCPRIPVYVLSCSPC